MKYSNFRFFTIAIIIVAVFSLTIPFQAGAARRSSSLQRSINNLDDDPVEELPNPILLGKAASNFTDTWGQARAQGRTHEGTDIFAPRGTYVVSPTDAVVTSAEASSTTNTLGGTYVYTANPGDERFYFAHLDKIADGIRTGKVLKAGDLIGYVGNTGNAAGGATHLHFGINSDHEAVNPFPRLTKEFTLEEKMDGLIKIIDDSDEPYVIAKALATTYRSVFYQAAGEGIAIPKEVAQTLSGIAPSTTATSTTVSTIPSTGIVTRDLTIGFQGEDVRWLQAFLITANKGLAAQALSVPGATGYFGPLTRSALIEYQRSVNIIPSSGYFGPITRAYLRTAGIVI